MQGKVKMRWGHRRMLGGGEDWANVRESRIGYLNKPNREGITNKIITNLHAIYISRSWMLFWLRGENSSNYDACKSFCYCVDQRGALFVAELPQGLEVPHLHCSARI